MKKFLFLAAPLLLAACQDAASHRAAVADNTADRLTVGKVQQNVHKGMSSAQVVESLGSPNIVTTESDGSETWVYDKISTEAAVSGSSYGVGGIGGGVGNGFGGGGLFSANSSSGAYSQSQKTLTVVVKFNKQHSVRDVAYHSSSF